MKIPFLAVAALLAAGAASAQVPLFAAKCPSGITADSNTQGQVYVNGKVAKLIKRPDGQITAQSAGVYVDITPRGSEPPRVTSTAKDKSFGECEILSFKAPDGGGGTAARPAAPQRASSSERAGQGQFDARGPVGCAMAAGQPMQPCQAAVARDGGGTATMVVTRPDGRTRFIFFEKGKGMGADLSQADGNMNFRSSKRGDTYLIEAGNERYEIVEAFVFGG
ncbi:MAG: hypothetical protein J0L57_10340 [Burkholderiales bacterium]|nr:hypothetical protein [Burkholderiales bacterium]